MNPKRCDILIIGAGPAGLQAAIHAARRNTSVIVLGKSAKSKLGWAWIENLFCILGEVSGKEMLKKGKKQAKRFGVEFVESDAVRITQNGVFECELETGKAIKADGLILSTGITRNKSDIDGERDFVGKGISYCADCDGPLYRDKRVAIVGGESAAFVAAQSLVGFASQVYLIDPKHEMSDGDRSDLQEKGIKILNRNPSKVAGENTVETLQFEDSSSIEIDGVFIEIGSRGIMELAMPLGLMPNEEGFLEVDREQKTELEGVFACGDITGPPFQVCKAIGEGCVAGLSAVEYVREHKD